MKIKAILIDALNREVRAVEFEGGSLDEMYALLDCECFTLAPLKSEGNDESLFVDDEGLINGTENFFYYKGAYQPLAGNGLFVGCDMNTGESCDTSIKIEDVISNVRFADRLHLAMMKMAKMPLEEFGAWPRPKALSKRG